MSFEEVYPSSLGFEEVLDFGKLRDVGSLILRIQFLLPSLIR